MNEDYLWDRTGKPDPELKQLEQALSSLRWVERQRNSTRALGQTGERKSRRWSIYGAVAAALLLTVGAAVAVREKRNAALVTSWQLSFAGETPRTMHAGESIETCSRAHGSLQSAAVGKVDIEPQSLLRILPAGGRAERLALDRGTIHAFIWAPPAQFVVDTPAAKAVDLGCKYTLHVDDGGSGLLTVEIGWVAFQWRGIESFIPAGSACRTRRGNGPSVPYFLDTSAAFRDALAAYDLHADTRALRRTLAAARTRDGLSLWHLLQRASPDQRGEVFDRFSKLVGVNPEITREAIIRGDKGALDASWNALNLGDTNWWRAWKGEW